MTCEASSLIKTVLSSLSTVLYIYNPWTPEINCNKYTQIIKVSMIDVVHLHDKALNKVFFTNSRTI